MATIDLGDLLSIVFCPYCGGRDSQNCGGEQALLPPQDHIDGHIRSEMHHTDEERARDPVSHLKWDRRYLGLAREVSTWSKDPSTQVGAVIVGPDNSIVSVGFNGFAKRVKDNPEDYANRDVKYKKVVHAEVNAIIFARRDLAGCTLYTWPFMPCCPCSGIVIQAGIARCVAPPTPADKVERWREDMRMASEQFEEAGVELSIVEEESREGQRTR